MEAEVLTLTTILILNNIFDNFITYIMISISLLQTFTFSQLIKWQFNQSVDKLRDMSYTVCIRTIPIFQHHLFTHSLEMSGYRSISYQAGQGLV